MRSLIGNKISQLIEKQVPGFIQEDYPLFVRFIEAYYEFLEQKQVNQDNDLYTRAKELISITDIDNTLDEFEDQFFNSYLTLFPKNTLASKNLLIKNSIPFYLAKGNEKSFKYFFRALFDEDIDIHIPKNDILIASGGKWINSTALRTLAANVYSYYTANSNTYDSTLTNKIFYLPREYYSSNLTVVADGVKKTTSQYYVQREYKKLVLTSSITSNLKIYFDTFDPSLLVNRKIAGKISGSSAIIEGQLAYKADGIDIFELEIGQNKTSHQDFINSEEFLVDIINEDGSLLYLNLNSFSTLKTINIVDGGSKYNVGDRVGITGGYPTTYATANVSSVYDGYLDKMDVNTGGAGFIVGAPITSYGLAGTEIVNGAISLVDTSGTYSANTYKFNNDLIFDVSGLLISTANYKTNYAFTASGVTAPNVNSKLIDLFSYKTVNDVGPISQAYLLYSNAKINLTPSFRVDGPNISVTSGNTLSPQTFYVKFESEGSIGRLNIVSGGSSYKVGDKLQFDNVVGGTGIGARGAVTKVDSIGTITQVELQPFPPSGNCFSATIVSGNTIVKGNSSNSSFLIDFASGQNVMIFNQINIVSSVQTNTQMTMVSKLTSSKVNTEIGKYDIYPLGGQAYSQSALPTVSVISSTGSGATIEAAAIMGAGANVTASGLHLDGEILSIEITNYGSNYRITPIINLASSGSKTATATAVINSSYYEYAGRYEGTYGQLSSDKKIQDSKFFNTGTYIIKTKQQFIKFKSALLNLLHPAGSQAFCYYTPEASEITVGNVMDQANTNLVKGIMMPTLSLDFISAPTLNTSIVTTDGLRTFYASNSNSNTSIINFSRASVATYIGPTGALLSSPINSPRFDYDPVTLAPKGLLQEETVINMVRNNQMIGAANATVGVPTGTHPTYWSTSATLGRTISVVGIGFENGLKYIDYRFEGTGTAVAGDPWAYAGVNFEQNTQTRLWANAANSLITTSMYVKKLTGDFTTVSQMLYVMQPQTITGTSVNYPGAGVIYTLLDLTTTMAASTERLIRSRQYVTMSNVAVINADSYYCSNYFQLRTANNVYSNVTIRFGGLQSERPYFGAAQGNVYNQGINTTGTNYNEGGFGATNGGINAGGPTSLIITSATGTDQTRNADFITIDIPLIDVLPPWYNQKSGTFFAEYQTSYKQSRFQRYPYIVSVASSSTTSFDRIELVERTDINWSFMAGRSENITITPSVGTAPLVTVVQTQVIKCAGSWTTNTANIILSATHSGAPAGVFNAGGAGNYDTGRQIVLALGADPTTASRFSDLNGNLRKISYYPEMLTAKALQVLTGNTTIAL